MTEEKVIYRGAEAKICLSKYMDFKVVEKRRLKKRYRIKKIDDRNETSIRSASETNRLSIPRRNQQEYGHHKSGIVCENRKR